MSFNSKYSGQQVENLLDQVASGNAGGGITTETDPIFSASPAYKITDGDIEEWDSKQDAISDLELIRNNASKGAQALSSIPTKVSELENDAKYASAEDTDDVVEEPEGGGSTGGSNVYTLDIGEWDGKSDIDDLPITAEVLENLLASDCVRIKYTLTDGIGDVYVYPMTENKEVFKESGILSYTFVGHDVMSGYGVYLAALDSGNGGIFSLVVEQYIPYQPVFFLGIYDEGTDSWTSLTDVGAMELNKDTYKKIKKIGYGGALSGMINSPLVVSPDDPGLFEHTSMLSYGDGVYFVFMLIVNVIKSDGTITRWVVKFDEDGTETYSKL